MRFAQIQISRLKAQIGELPETKKARFVKEYELNEYDAGLLVETKERAEYFEECVNESMRQSVKGSVVPKTLANWIINKKIDLGKVSPAQLVDQIVQSTATSPISDDELEKIIKAVLAENPKAVEDYKKGREQALMFLVGQAMKISKGKASAETLKERFTTAM